jgi:D-arabinose 1-dehydrogenase-like Zn-dependent alcohol dehydrogenase
MRAMQQGNLGSLLRLRNCLIPNQPGEVWVRGGLLGVRRTDLHVVDGELPNQSCRLFPVTKSLALSIK